MIDFPASPTVGQTFVAPNGVTYRWDGVTWTSLGYAQGIPDAPSDGKTYGRKNASWVEILASGGGWVITNPTANDILATLPAPAATGNSTAAIQAGDTSGTPLLLFKNGATNRGSISANSSYMAFWYGRDLFRLTGTQHHMWGQGLNLNALSAVGTFINIDGTGGGIYDAAPELRLNKTAQAGFANLISGRTAGSARWNLYLGNGDSESGTNKGTNLELVAQADNGTPIATYLRVLRSNGYLLLGHGAVRAAALNNTLGDVAIEMSKAVVATNCRLTSNMNGSLRWSMDIGNGEAESGGNAGSNFVLTKFSDAGASVDQVLKISRSDGYVTWIGSGMNVNGNAMTAPPDWTTIQVRAKVNSGLEMFANSTTGSNLIAAFVGPPLTGRRWNLWMGDGAEGANNTGSNINFQAMDNSGNYLRSVMILYRDSGEAKFSGTVRAGGDVIGNTYYGVNANTWRVQGGGGWYQDGNYHRVFTIIENTIGDTLQMLGYHQPGVSTFWRFQVGGSGNYFDMNNNGVGYSPGGWNSSSDGRVKINRSVIGNALDKLLNITGYVYDKLSPMGEVSREAGVIAQDVETVLPETVTVMDNATTAMAGAEHVYTDFRALNYNGVTALLVNAVKELSGRLDAAMARIATLEKPA